MGIKISGRRADTYPIQIMNKSAAEKAAAWCQCGKAAGINLYCHILKI
jgi:hypothetical protein